MKSLFGFVLIITVLTIQGQAFESELDSLQTQEEYHHLVDRKALPKTVITGGILGGLIVLFPTTSGQIVYAIIIGASSPFISLVYIKNARRKAVNELGIDPDIAKLWDRTYREYRKRIKSEKKNKRRQN